MRDLELTHAADLANVIANKDTLVNDVILVPTVIMADQNVKFFFVQQTFLPEHTRFP